MPAPPPAQDIQPQHYGRGRGGRPRGGYGQNFAHQQHAQPYPPQYASPQWQQPQPYYPQQNGAQAMYTAANHFNPYNYYTQQYGGYNYYNAPYQNFIAPQPSTMYGSQALPNPYVQAPYAMNPQMPMIHAPQSPFTQPQAPTVPPTTSAVPNVPLTPASAHSSQLAAATSNEAGQQPTEVPEQLPQPDALVNGNGNVDSESLQQADLWSPFELSVATDEDTPKPNPKFSMSQVSSTASIIIRALLSISFLPPPFSAVSLVVRKFLRSCTDHLINRFLTTLIQIARRCSQPRDVPRRKSSQLRVKTSQFEHRSLDKPKTQ